jgi:hypothetical protein
MTYVDLLMSALSSPNSLSESRLASRTATEKQISKLVHNVLKNQSQGKGIETTWGCWISLEHFLSRNDDVQKCLAGIAVQRRIEEERQRMAWGT